ncbi:hypothetical protein ES708_17541 [subsurface metagenome]
MFHKTAEELRELDKENNIKLLGLLRYLRKRKGRKSPQELQRTRIPRGSENQRATFLTGPFLHLTPT